jgi:hypothetical protein
MVFLTSVIDPNQILSDLDQYSEDLLVYCGLVLATTSLGLFIRGLIK